MAAAHLAGALSLDDAALVAATHARLVQRLAVGRGDSLVVAAAPEVVAGHLAAFEEPPTLAGRLGPASTLVSGDTTAIRSPDRPVRGSGHRSPPGTHGICIPLAADGPRAHTPAVGDQRHRRAPGTAANDLDGHRERDRRRIPGPGLVGQITSAIKAGSRPPWTQCGGARHRRRTGAESAPGPAQGMRASLDEGTEGARRGAPSCAWRRFNEGRTRHGAYSPRWVTCIPWVTRSPPDPSYAHHAGVMPSSGRLSAATSAGRGDAPFAAARNRPFR
ncbi:hypothetical protein [Salinispora arenicola]|uniref:hypothetical protein n=1 Tax=Salinispora arenicola TaxID=168697 RepID=UPI0027DDC429|nr:hypothetical protein [Salinispora arenicola]